MDVITFVVEADEARHEVVHMTYLELDGHGFVALQDGQRLCDEVEVCQTEVVSILQLRVPAIRHKDDVLLDILLHNEPRTTTQAQAFPLTDGVEPKAFVLSDNLTRFDVYNLSLLFAHKTTQKIVIVYLSKEANALTILASGTRQFCIEGNLAHLFFHEMAYRENGMSELFVTELRKEVGLVLDRVFSCSEPHLTVPLDVCGVMACGYVIVTVPYPLLKRAELDETVAHHVGIGRKTFLYSLDSIANDLLPVFLLKVGHLEFQPVLSGCCLREFYVLFCRTRRVFPVHTYFYVM